MSSFGVEVLPEAEAEAREAFLWYFDRSPIAADAFRVELFDAIDGLSETARDWPEDEDGTRHYHFKHFPYTVMYEAGAVGRPCRSTSPAAPSSRPPYVASVSSNRGQAETELI